MSLTGAVPFKVYRPLAENASGEGIHLETLADTATLTWRSETIQSLDGGVANRDVVLPPAKADATGVTFRIYNRGATNTLAIKDVASTVATLAVGETGWFTCDGVNWKLGARTSPAVNSTTTANVWTNTNEFGVSGTGVDVTFYGDTATRDLIWDYSADVLRAQDNTKIGWGSGAGTTPDIAIAWDGTDLLVTQLTADSIVKWGVSGAGINHVFYGDTASASMVWDQSADSLILSGVAKIVKQTIAAASGTAIPVTHSGSFPITSGAASTNTLADPTYIGQTLSIFIDTDGGAHVITADSRINQAGNTIITMSEVGDFIKLEAITIAGALKWQVVANDGCVLT